jgi:lipopolysaccharide export system permease protein
VTIVFRHVLALYLRFFGAIFAAVLAIYLIADIGDRVKLVAAHALSDVAELYWNKGMVAARQLWPAAMLLASAAGVSTLRKRGELTALRALSFSPAAIYLPVGVGALALAAGLVVFDEGVVTRASARVDEIALTRFHTWGDWRFHFRPKQWFRRRDRIFFLRGGDLRHGFEDVTVLTLSPDFALLSRLDADRMVSAGGDAWELTGVRERLFHDGKESELRREVRSVRDLGAPPATFNIRTGRPEQMRVSELREQVAVRRLGGLPTTQFRLALHSRFAYPLTGFAAALLAVGLALRPGRKGHLTVALVEGLAIAVALWGMTVVGKALTLADRIPVSVAAWGPAAVLVVVATALWLRREGRLGWRGI